MARALFVHSRDEGHLEAVFAYVDTVDAGAAVAQGVAGGVGGVEGDAFEGGLVVAVRVPGEDGFDAVFLQQGDVTGTLVKGEVEVVFSFVQILPDERAVQEEEDMPYAFCATCQRQLLREPRPLRRFPFRIFFLDAVAVNADEDAVADARREALVAAQRIVSRQPLWCVSQHIVVARHQPDRRIERREISCEDGKLKTVVRFVDQVARDEDGVGFQSVGCRHGFLHQRIRLAERGYPVTKPNLRVGHVHESDGLRAGNCQKNEKIECFFQGQTGWLHKGNH